MPQDFSRLTPERKCSRYLRQTLANYAKLGPAASFSGPIVRGDAHVVGKHMKELKKIPEAREVYLALARASDSLSAVSATAAN